MNACVFTYVWELHVCLYIYRCKQLRTCMETCIYARVNVYACLRWVHTCICLSAYLHADPEMKLCMHMHICRHPGREDFHTCWYLKCTHAYSLIFCSQLCAHLTFMGFYLPSICFCIVRISRLIVNLHCLACSFGSTGLPPNTICAMLRPAISAADDQVWKADIYTIKSYIYMYIVLCTSASTLEFNSICTRLRRTHLQDSLCKIGRCFLIRANSATQRRRLEEQAEFVQKLCPALSDVRNLAAKWW